MDPSILQKLQKSLASLISDKVLNWSKNGVAPNKEFVAELGNNPVFNCYLAGINEDKVRRELIPCVDLIMRVKLILSYKKNLVMSTSVICTLCGVKTNSTYCFWNLNGEWLIFSHALIKTDPQQYIWGTKVHLLFKSKYFCQMEFSIEWRASNSNSFCNHAGYKPVWTIGSNYSS